MKKLLLALVRTYQKVISPLFQPSCRYYPTCSHYTVQALEKHGAAKGSVMGIARILRCNPFVKGGVDKVPDHFTIRRNPDSENETYLGSGITVKKSDLTKQNQKEKME
jgi:hypothetical protein